MAADGVGPWGGAGAGALTGEGMGVGFTGALYFQTNSPYLSELNQMAVVYEFDIDSEGNASGGYCQWR